MKIAILTPTFFHYSGIDRVAELQALDYAKKGNQVTVFAFEATLKSHGYKLEIIGMPKNSFFQRMYRLLFFLSRNKIKNTANKLKGFDVVISHFYPMNWIASYAKKRYDTKYIYYNHGIGYSGLFNNVFERVYMKLFAFFNRISLANVDSTISISKFMQAELNNQIGLDSKVVYDKIDKSKFRKNLDGSGIRKKLGVGEKEKLLLFVGRLSPHKNVHSLLTIFSIVNEKCDNVKLLIVGKPTFPNYYRKLKKMSNTNVIFMEFVEDKQLPYYYAACDLYVTASLWEGFNLPAAEAQACGKKVVAFDVCSHPEVIKNGILVKKNDINGFVNAILTLLKLR